jgi:hypothetical protein
VVTDNIDLSGVPVCLMGHVITNIDFFLGFFGATSRRTLSSSESKNGKKLSIRCSIKKKKPAEGGEISGYSVNLSLC